MIYNKILLCIVDYYNKFLDVKMMASLSADDLVHTTKITFAQFGLPKKIISDLGTTFTSEIFTEFCKMLNI